MLFAGFFWPKVLKHMRHQIMSVGWAAVNLAENFDALIKLPFAGQRQPELLLEMTVFRGDLQSVEQRVLRFLPFPAAS